ncbi:uncharacterized protein [Nicotiana sylvestris]|uniref:uncharacterized protein n=1 Tax=Nicotiana sylvestris TaxID=4096 RepID=UPI00388C61E0
MESWNYENFDVGNSTFNPPYAYCEGNHPGQNYQNIPESEFCAPTQSYVWNVCNMRGGQDGHFHGCAYSSYLPPTPYFDGSSFSCEVNSNKELKYEDLKEIEDMLKCLTEQYDEIQLRVQRQGATIYNLEAQANKLFEPCKAQQVDIVDSSQYEHELAVEIAIILEDLKKYEDELEEEARVEHQQSIALDFEDFDVVEEILESTKDIEDTYLVDSIITKGFSTFTLDFSHPFYAHPSDSPGTYLVSSLFDGTGFVAWKKSMLVSLSTKNKLGLINGRHDKHAEDSPYYPYWERCNDMVISGITNSLSREIATSVLGYNTAREIWLDINERLRSLWDEMNTAYVGPVCSCGALPKFLEELKLFWFLAGINDSYSTVKSNILMMTPLPTRIQFETKRSNQFVSFMYYKKPGHTIEKCCKLHEFPSDFKFNKNKRSAFCVHVDASSSGILSASPQGSTTPDISSHGFTQEQYQHLMSLLQHSHIYHGANNNNPSSVSSRENTAYANFAGLFCSSVVNSVNFRACASSQFTIDTWILDSGATNHMTPHKHLLHNLTPLARPYLITLPNGYKVKGPSLKRPQEIGRANNGVYFLHLGDDVQSLVCTLPSPCTTSDSSVFTCSSSIYVNDPISLSPSYLPNFPPSPISTSAPPSSVPSPLVVSHAPSSTFAPPYSTSSPPAVSHAPLSIPASSSTSPPAMPHAPYVYIPTRHSSRISNPHAHLRDYVCPSLASKASTSLASKVSSSALHMNGTQFYQQAVSHPTWQKAMLKEFQALDANHTWDIVPLPPHKKPMPCKWVYKIKKGLMVPLKDVNNAFLHGDLHEEVYMKIPPYLQLSSTSPSSSSPLVCRLRMSLYGLKQASKQWFSKLSEALLSRGYIPSKNDYSLFLKSTGSSHTVLVVCIDNILLAGDDIFELDVVKAFLDAQFKIKDLGSIHYFLGLEVTKVDTEFHCQKFSSMVTPMDGSVKLSTDMGEPLSDPSTYRRIHLSQFLQAPQVPHMLAAIHVLRKSVSGYFITLGGCSVSWKSKKQQTVSLSSAEAEYRALRQVVAEVSWLLRLLADFGVSITHPVPIFCDNQATLHIAKNPMFHERTKHIEIDCHYLRDSVTSGLVSLHYVASADQLADIMTKPLTAKVSTIETHCMSSL